MDDTEDDSGITTDDNDGEHEEDQNTDVSNAEKKDGEVTAQLDKGHDKNSSNKNAVKVTDCDPPMTGVNTKEKETDTVGIMSSEGSLTEVSGKNTPSQTPVTASDNVDQPETLEPKVQDEGMQPHAEGKKEDGSETGHKVSSRATTPELQGNTTAAAGTKLASLEAGA
jgi:hypothetical protein